MAVSEFVFDATITSFETEVMQKSLTTPVLVDFWAPWCGPCQSLGPLIERIVGEYAGAVLLAKVDTDKEPQLAQAFGIRSLPTVMLFKNGQPVDGFMGLQREPEIRALIERHAGPAPLLEDEITQDVLDLTARIEALRAKVEAEPDKAELKLDLAQALIKAADADLAEQVLASLPDKFQQDKQTLRLRQQLALLRSIDEAPSEPELVSQLKANPDNHRARHQLATLMLLGGAHETALDLYLDLLKRDRSFDDGLARRSLIAAFDLLEDEDLVATYRRRMASLLF
jgi:putative thioredoxin